MLTRVRHLPVFMLVCGLAYCAAATVQAQTSPAELQQLLQQKAAFAANDFAALQQGETIVKPAPVQDKHEVALSGLVSVRASADEFLRSYRESLTQRSNAAVVELGSFSSAPELSDLQTLTLDADDIEALKECAVGNCRIKLSAAMIERFTHEVNWQAADYAQQATQLFRSILVDYVRDYRTRGDAALIEYNDKPDEVRLADEERAVSSVPGYLNDILSTASDKSDLQPIEELLVWSKMKFGLKPVITINHVTIYKSDRELGPQVLAVSKQIYASHYFNSSLALTAFVTVAGPASYLVYENRSRADAFDGPFSKIKRNLVQSKAVAGLKGVLERTKLSLEPQLATAEPSTAVSYGGWGQRLFGGIRPLLWFMIISGLIAFILLRNYEGKTRAAGVKQLKPEER